MSENNKYQNELINSKSPYLLQHADNPVDWRMWSEAAFEQAKKEDKPVFLSIGYSACHWCHVMAHESFEDEEVAQMLNKEFINVKVDREERPDIDAVYMRACQMLTGGGGWPLTIIMTPDQKPFFAATYIPKETAFGRFGIKELILKIGAAWRERREEVLRSADSITEKLNIGPTSAGSSQVSPQVFDVAYDSLVRTYDKDFGGFGSKPKFPMTSNLTFLTRYSLQNPVSDALKMTEKTLDIISKGGIRDHLGFGFHRYSTDNKWLIPHFEKMLYDQALLIDAYAEAFQLTKNPVFRNAALTTVDYAVSCLKSPEGAFYAAEDADSEGEEGKFYLWDYNEINDCLGDEAEIFRDAYGVLEKGNFIEEHQSEPKGVNILYKCASDEDLADKHKTSVEDVIKRLDAARVILLSYRDKKTRPALDDKILIDSNALMISGLAKAAVVFDRKEIAQLAAETTDFILKLMTDSEGRLLRSYKNGEAEIPGNLDDYAYMIAALLDLYAAELNPERLRQAIKLDKILSEGFWDKEDGAYFFTADYAEKLISRQKELFDGARPSGTSVQLMNLIKLNKLTGDEEYKKKAIKITQCFGGAVNNAPFAYPYFLSAMDLLIGETKEIVVSAEKEEEFTREALRLIHDKFLPGKTLILKTKTNASEIEAIAPFVKDMNTVDGKTAVYVCSNNTCAAPVFELEELEKLLSGE